MVSRIKQILVVTKSLVIHVYYIVPRFLGAGRKLLLLVHPPFQATLPDEQVDDFFGSFVFVLKLI